ncbi:MAG: hypothetical protein A3E36_00750 [Candidatus Andersenbacteria bacterium RIFCSPHIGHO2_12_FULL_45_11b]|uniref:Methyltransferase domain-containing protein n=1 Tax=Candidatus Andersenbacteria bacterium RIFCSPHIGHO2_12_FULL_45_11b TaxID=1797282 RepID=A0A1G1X6H5_9BACT|nr:MAG: hypothetical protein A3E36_00750 [Candidatus Andersenbacteria bacterium RIFCSPHIGHO2_12_FULL_45_11b]
MDVLLLATLIGSGLLLPTAYAGIIGAPWAPTRIAVVKKAFDAVGISEKDVLVDLGCGDGKIMHEAAKRGAKTIGYELSPIMWCIAWMRTMRDKKTQVHYGNFFKLPIPPDTTYIFAFLMPKHMQKIREYIAKQPVQDATIIFSYAFPMQDVPPRMIFRAKKCAPLYMYTVKDIR